MKSLFTPLQERLSAELQQISDETNAVKGYNLRRDLVEEYIKELKEYVSGHPFPDKTDEIYYYKHVAPVFYQQYFNFDMLYRLESERITLDEKDFSLILQKELEKANHFLTENHELHRYFRSGQDIQDEELFTREKSRRKRDKLTLDLDGHFCEDSRQLSLILAYERHRVFLKKELEQPSQTYIPQEQVDCNASKSDAVALAVAIFESKWFRIKKNPATLRQIVERTEQYFNMDLKDYEGLDQASRRNKGRLTLFDNLKLSWTNRKKQLDDKNDKRK
jgi:hypothetical protein